MDHAQLSEPNKITTEALETSVALVLTAALKTIEQVKENLVEVWATGDTTDTIERAANTLDDEMVKGEAIVQHDVESRPPVAAARSKGRREDA